MRRVFLDCGAHCGCSRKKWESLHPGYEIISFEADPELCESRPELINKAVSTENGVATFYKFGTIGASSLLEVRSDLLKKNKPKYYPPQIIEVETIDLNEFILNNFNSSDYLVLKLDVEGAEYNILPHLVAGGAIQLIKEFYVEWHDVRVGISPTKSKELTDTLKAYGLTPVEWDAMQPKFCIMHK